MEQFSPETNIILPKGFLLGAASSAHQVEGQNMNSDWWAAEQQGLVPKSGEACDHYNRYDEDFRIAQDIGLNAFRISIEWARIEPLEGKWDKVAIEHYRKVLKKMKELGLTRMVTLHHFTLPLWLAEKGGFESSIGAAAFGRFAWFIAQNLGDEIDLWCTINEPEVYVGMSYSMGKWPPFKKNKLLGFTVLRNLITAHKKAYEAIKQVKPQAQVGLAKNNAYYEAYRKLNPFDRLLAWASDTFGNNYFLRKTSGHLDFIGLNYYFYNSIKFSITGGLKDMNFNFLANHPTDPVEVQRSDMGWRTFPEGVYHLLKSLKKYHKPIYITENGIANARDDMRKNFIKQHLYWTRRAIDEGADVRGYFYWSLTDNYEWSDGYNPLFGLVEVDYSTQERKIRKSAEVIKEISFDE